MDGKNCRHTRQKKDIQIKTIFFTIAKNLHANPFFPFQLKKWVSGLENKKYQMKLISLSKH